MALNLFCFQSNVMADELLGYTATKARKTAHRTLEVRVKNAVDGVDMTSFSTQANNDSNRTGVGKSGELMKTGNVLGRVYGVTAALIGVLFFFIIVGVFGLHELGTSSSLLNRQCSQLSTGCFSSLVVSLS
jgi:hypothetical protein